jgi:amidase
VRIGAGVHDVGMTTSLPASSPAAGSSSPTGVGDLLLSHDALGLAELVRRREVTPLELVDASIGRIERYDHDINAVVHRLFERARRDARAPLPAESERGPFAGVPFLLKDLLAWIGGEPITSGSRLYDGFIAPHDSEVVARCRRAGLITLGRTNTPEFGLTPFTEPTRFGPTRNPWDLTRTVGGSSGGSAAAVAAGYVPMAGGGDGGGSIRIPASCCGVFGLKPTRGRVPTGPHRGEVWRGAVAEHVITRSVRDSAVMLDMLAGPDVGAPYAAAPPARPFRDEVGAPPGRLRIAFTAAPLLGHATHRDCVAALEDAAALLESLGHTLVEDAPVLDRERFNQAYLTIVCAELWAEFEEAVALVGRRARRRDVEPASWALALLGHAISAGEYAVELNYLQRTARDVGAFHERYDALLTPTLGTPPFPVGALQPRGGEAAAIRILGAIGSGTLMRRLHLLEQAAEKVFDFIPITPICNVTGQPAMSVPLHWNADGLPIGVQLAARYGDEALLFRLAAQLERARPWFHRRPSLPEPRA